MSKPIGADEMLDRIKELELAVRYEADLAQQALDAREELETKKYHDAWLEVEIAELEAKLAKALEALEQIATHRKKCHEYDDDVGHERREFDVEDMIIMEYAACTTLAELKGQDDE